MQLTIILNFVLTVKFSDLSTAIYLEQASKLHPSWIFNWRSMVFRIMPRLSYEAIREMRRERKLQAAKRMANAHRGDNESIKDKQL